MAALDTRLDLLSVTLSFAGLGILSAVLPSVLPEIRAEFGINNVTASQLFALWGLGLVLGSSGSAWGIKETMLRHLPLVSRLLMLAGLYLAFTEARFWLLSAAFALMGVAAGLVIVSGHAIVGAAGDRRQIDRLGTIELAASLGTLITPALVNYLTQHSLSVHLGAWRSILVPIALFYAAGLAIDLLRPPPAELHLPETAPKDRLADLLRHPAFWLFLIVSFGAQSIEYAHASWFVAYASSIEGLDGNAARELLVAFFFGVFISRALLSSLPDLRSVYFFLAAAASVTLTVMFYMPEYHTYVALCTANLTLGCAIGLMYPSVLGLAMRHFNGQTVVISSLALFIGTIGAKSSAVLFGFLIDRFGPGILFPVLAGYALLLFPLIFLLLRNVIVPRRTTLNP